MKTNKIIILLKIFIDNNVIHFFLFSCVNNQIKRSRYSYSHFATNDVEHKIKIKAYIRENVKCTTRIPQYHVLQYLATASDY